MIHTDLTCYSEGIKYPSPTYGGFMNRLLVDAYLTIEIKMPIADEVCQRFNVPTPRIFLIQKLKSRNPNFTIFGQYWDDYQTIYLTWDCLREGEWFTRETILHELAHHIHMTKVKDSKDFHDYVWSAIARSIGSIGHPEMEEESLLILKNKIAYPLELNWRGRIRATKLIRKIEKLARGIRNGR